MKTNESVEKDTNKEYFFRGNNGNKLIPVHINKARDDEYFWDWSSDNKCWIKGEKIPENLKRMYKHPKPI
jgi:hypothetical protein